MKLLGFCVLLFCPLSFASLPLNIEGLPFSEGQKEKIKKGEVLAISEVQDQKIGEKKTQSLNYRVAGLHPKSCAISLRKLSQYDQLHHYLDVIHSSHYEEKGARLKLLLKSIILPKDMILDFSLPKITEKGVYPFSFDQGFLKGLTGTIHVSEYSNRCLFFTQANWSGPDTGYPNIVLTVFSENLSKVAMKRLFHSTSR